MEKLITWKKGFFSNTFQLFENGIPVGTLSFAVWSNKATGILYDKEFEFKTKGFFNPETNITDIKSGTIIGIINYNTWKTKATINLTDGKVCNWQYSNLWHTKWVLSQSLYFINYRSSSIKGEIISHLSDEVLILSGLFISNYFTRANAAIAAAT